MDGTMPQRPPIDVFVDSRVRFYLRQLTEPQVEALKAVCTHENPNAGQPLEPAFLRTYRTEDDMLTLPRGRYRQAVQVLAPAALWVHDDRAVGEPEKLDVPAYEVPAHLVKPWPWQKAASAALYETQNCLLRAPTGSGKTCALLALPPRMQVPTLVMVRTHGLLEQWAARIVEELGIPEDQIGIIGDGRERTAMLTVAMQQTIIQRFKDCRAPWLWTFGAVLVDEVQDVAAPTCFAAVDPFPAKYRIGASADPSRKDRLECLIFDLFGRIAADIKHDDIVKAGHTLEVEIRVVPTAFEADWYRTTMMRDSRGFAAKRAFNKLLAEMTNDDARNTLIHDIIAREVQAGEQVLVMSHRREHCLGIDQRLVGAGIRTGVMLGGQLGRTQFERTAAGLKVGDVRAAVGTLQAIGQAIDLPSVGVGVVTTPLANNRQKWGQARGRVCRSAKGKTRAVLYYMLDRAIYGRRAIENLVKWNKRVVVLDRGEWVEGKRYLDGGGVMAGALARGARRTNG
jgi:superfamily II DNA or RNA helicase